MRLLCMLLCCGWCASAAAQPRGGRGGGELDACLGVNYSVELSAVQAAWKAALKGAPDARKKLGLPRGGPCGDPNAFSPVTQVDLECDASGRRAAVLSGHCRARRVGEPEVNCGVAMLDLEAQRFVQFVPGSGDGVQQQRFVGPLFVTVAREGFELRWGKAFEQARRFAKGQPLEASADGAAFYYADEPPRLMRWAVGKGEPAVVAAGFGQLSSAQWLEGGGGLGVLGFTPEGRPRLLVLQEGGAVLFDVAGAVATAVEPGAKRLFGIFEDARDGSSRVRLELRAAGGEAPVAVEVALPGTGAVQLIADWSANRVLVGRGGAVAVVSLEPFAVARTVRPFGAAPFTLHSMDLSSSGRAVMLYGVEGTGAEAKGRLSVVPLDGGPRVDLPEGWQPSWDERRGLRLVAPASGTTPARMANVSDEGKLTDGQPPPVTASDACYERASATVRTLARVGVQGVLLPASAVK